jgi:hypothetical protein
VEQTAQDEVHEREQRRVPPREAGESAMLPDDAAQTRCHDFCTPHGHQVTDVPGSERPTRLNWMAVHSPGQGPSG